MKTARLFQDHMVIQRGKPFSIWGTGKDGESVRVILGMEERKTVVSGGEWKVEFPPMEKGKGLVLTVESADEKKIITDVALGEVWVAGGQSNMEFHMLFDADYEDEKEKCLDSDIRFFDYPEVSYEEQEQDFDYSKVGYWRMCTPEDLKFFCAPGYYFAKKLRQDLDVPVGIIGCNWGGTTASSWMSEEFVRRHGQVWIDEYEENVATITDMESYKEMFRKNGINNRGCLFDDPFTMMVMPGVSREDQLTMMENWKEEVGNEDYNNLLNSPLGPNRPGQLYHTMVKKIAGYAIRGVIWYQGESDEPHAGIYKDVFLDLVKCWRETWNDDLPFITAQLAPFEAWLESNGDNYPEIRKQQWLAAQEEGIYMISTSDVGMRFDIHPKKKRPVGERMALMAESEVYKLEVLGHAPEGEKAVKEERGISILFKHVGDGLHICGNHPNALEIKTKDGKGAEILSCKIEKDKLYIEIKDFSPKEKYAVMFAKTPYYEVNIYNSAKIPAIPFVLYTD